MIQQTIEELRKIKEVMIGNDDFTQDDLYTIDKAIIACEQLRKARKKAKRWKRKYLKYAEQEPCDDAISREDVLAEITRFSTEEGASVECQQLYCDVYNMPSVTQKPIECDDVVSRQAVLDGIEELKQSPWATDKRNGFEYLITEALDVVADLCVKQEPSVRPQEPTGHWILDETDNSITCDKCGCLIWANDISNGEAYYCPNCGARMVEPQESEDKE